MGFLQRIKRDIARTNSGRASPYRDKELVNAKALHVLIAQFEKLDTDFRVNELSKRPDSDYQLLDALIHKLWHDNGKNADQIMHVFSKSLAKLLDDKINNTPSFEPKQENHNFKIEALPRTITDKEFQYLMGKLRE